jgi:preprotein translocase subunit SecG
MITHELIEMLLVIFSITTIGLVIMNQPQSGDTFGASASISQTRRGFEKQIHILTILSSSLLLALVLLSQVI